MFRGVERTLTAGQAFGLRLALMVFFLLPGRAFGAQDIASRSREEVALYRALAHASARAYDDAQPGLQTTPSGCVALIREDGIGNLVVAFRGSMLGDRAARHPFSSFGGETMRRNYRDWVATNLKQTAGFLPRQYVEAAELVVRQARAHPVDKLVFITGHSKGGGAATYAYVAACISPELSPEQKRRLRCVTFNAAVVREQNWRRLFRGERRDAAADRPAAGSVTALVMRDDPVSKIAAAEEREYVERIIVPPTTDLAPSIQHGIEVLLDELEKSTINR